MSDDTLKYRNKKDPELILEIESDTTPMNPREWDNLGTMACNHREYVPGDKKHDLINVDTDEWHKWLKDHDAVFLKLYLLDHSGLAMRSGSFMEDPGGWDSGIVGFIYALPEKIKAEYGADNKANRAKAVKCMEAEIKNFDQYLRGDCVGFTTYKMKTCKECAHESKEVIDSCWGFYGFSRYDKNDESGLWDNVGDRKEWKEIE